MYANELIKYLQMVSDYMELIYDYSIEEIKCNDNEVDIVIQEYTSMPYTLRIKDGRIYNSYNYDCIETMKSAYDKDTDMLKWIKNFENKWYGGNTNESKRGV